MITKTQALSLKYREEVHYGPCIVDVGPRGGETLHQERWRVSGRPVTFVTRPDDWSVPVKHGLYDNTRIASYNQEAWHLASTCKPSKRLGKPTLKT